MYCIYKNKSVCITNFGLFGEIGAIFFLYNFYREHSLLKLKIKKLKISVQNIKKSIFLDF